MKKYLLLLMVVTLACTQEKTTTQNTSSVQKYSIPVFTDSAAFNKISQYFSVIDTVFSRHAKKNSFPSIAYGLVIGDKLVYSNATGLANVKDNRKATSKTLYRIASMSKSFTAMAIIKLRDEGKLTLNDPVTKHIPAFAGAGQLTSDAKIITILDLLTMSAGFPEDNPWGDRQMDIKDQELIDHVQNGVSFSNVPGTTYEYSNMGFALLGNIITKVSGVPYEQYITDNIMKPIGMNDAKWEYSEVPADIFAQGYRWEDNTWKEEPVLHDGAYGAMGGIICSIEDFAKYASLHLSAWPPRNGVDNGPVKRGSIREMHQPSRFNTLMSNAKNLKGEVCPAVTGYGYGLAWRRNCERTIRISHSGGFPGYGSEWRIYPEYNMSIVSFANLTYASAGLPNGIALDTLIYLAGLQKRVLPPSEILKQRYQEIVSLLPDFNDAASKKIFAENFWMDHDAASRQRNIKKVFEQAGRIVRVKDLEPENQLRGIFEIECENRKVHVYFTLTPEKEALIQQLDIGVF